MRQTTETDTTLYDKRDQSAKLDCC